MLQGSGSSASQRRMKTHKTAVVIIPPEPVWPPIQAIRRRHDRHARRWMPHITLLYPFLPAEVGALRLRASRTALASVAPFRLTLRTMRFFDHGRGRYTLWLAPEPASAVERVQAALQGAVPACDDVRRHAGGFTPHLSLGQARGGRERDALLAEWQTAWRPLVFRVDHVALIERGDPPDDIFREVERLPLGVPAA